MRRSQTRNAFTMDYTKQYEQLELMEIERYLSDGDSDYRFLLEKPTHRSNRLRNGLCRMLFAIKGLLWFLLPSFVQDMIGRRFYPRYQPHCPPLRSTTWLDGLRGVACILVMNGHWIGKYNAWMVYGYGVRDSHFMQLPYLRLVLGAYPMVGCFFAISGYALSLRALQFIRKGQIAEANAAISSAVFRRWFRLCVPVIVASLFTMFLAHFGAFELFEDCIQTGGCNAPQWKPPRLPTLWEQFANWWDNVVRWIVLNPYIFTHEISETAQSYDVNLWTIPVEFTSSMVVFVILLALAPVRTRIRLSIIAVLIVHAIYSRHNSITPFIFGVFLAEADLIRDERRRLDLPRRFIDTLQRENVLQYILFAFGMFLFSQPLVEPENAFFFRNIWHLIPSGEAHFESQRFFPNFGVMMVMWAVSNSPRLKKLFTNPVSHYLGRISFMVYIVHGEWGLNVLGVRFTYAFWDLVGHRGNMGTIPAYFVTVAAVIWTADVFWRAVDIPSVRFARWVEGKCT